jgi:hypothetical protein
LRSRHCQTQLVAGHPIDPHGRVAVVRGKAALAAVLFRIDLGRLDFESV